MIDRQRVERFHAYFAKNFELLFVDFVASFDVYFTSIFVDDVFGEIAAVEVLLLNENLLQAIFLELADAPGRQFFTRFDDDIAGLCIDQVVRQPSLPSVNDIFL